MAVSLNCIFTYMKALNKSCCDWLTTGETEVSDWSELILWYFQG